MRCNETNFNTPLTLNLYLGFFKFYQPKATGGGFLIFEWTLRVCEETFLK
jgi:hypothetical protein